MRQLLATTLLFILTLSILSQNPGINVAVRPQAITDFKNAILPSILAQLQSISIPNFNVGDLSMSNVQITSFNIPVDQINIAFSNGAISVTASGLSVNVQLYIQANLPFGINIGADTTASASNSDLSFTADIGYSNQDVQINLQGVNVNIDNLNIQIGGVLGQVASAIINLVTPLLQGDINNAIAGALESNLQTTLNNALANINDYTTLPGVPLGADYQVMSVPIVESDYISIPINGTFYDDEIPFANPPIIGACTIPTIDETTSEEVQFFISEYVFNSATYGLFEAGYLALNVTQSMVPSGSPVTLDTTSLTILFPGMDTIYGANQPVQLICENGESYPTVSIATSGVEGATTATCSVQVFATNNTWVQALMMNLSLEFGGDISISNYSIFVNLTNAQISNVTVSDSTIPNINTDQVSDVINAILIMALPTIDNSWFDSGIPIPAVPNTNLTSADLTLYDCYFKVGATPVFNSVGWDFIFTN